MISPILCHSYTDARPHDITPSPIACPLSRRCLCLLLAGAGAAVCCNRAALSCVVHAAAAGRFRLGRQEDAHEYLRCLLDAMHESCLAHLKPRPPPGAASSTLVYSIFSGRLRSQASGSCVHGMAYPGGRACMTCKCRPAPLSVRALLADTVRRCGL